MPVSLFVIVGMCGSGKSWLLRRLKNDLPLLHTMDEGFARPTNERDFREREIVFAQLQSGGSCVITELNCCQEHVRHEVMEELAQRAPGTEIGWFFFEKDRATADNNCRRDSSRDPKRVELNLAHNAQWERVYTIPANALMLKVHSI